MNPIESKTELNEFDTNPNKLSFLLNQIRNQFELIS